jgi:hypothetical protein
VGGAPCLLPVSVHRGPVGHESLVLGLLKWAGIKTGL